MKQLLSLILIALSTLSLVSCNERVKAGYEGVLFNDYGTDKGIQKGVLVAGRVWFNPATQTLFQSSLRRQTLDYPAFAINAQDGSEFGIDPTLVVQMRAGYSPELIGNYGKSVEEILATNMYANVREAYRIGMNTFSTEAIISNRRGFENVVQHSLDSMITKDGWEMLQLTSGLKYPRAIVEAIEKKNTAVQKALEVENSLRQAEALKKKKIIDAEGDAEAMRLRKVELTPLIVQDHFIEKWDGKTPLYGSAPVLFKNVN